MEQKQVQTFDAWSVLPAALGTLAMLVAAQVFDANASVVIALIGTAVYLAPVGRTGIRRPWLNYALLAIADAGIVVLRFGNLSESAQRPVFWRPGCAGAALSLGRCRVRHGYRAGPPDGQPRC
jgi:hypothetical protein